MFHQYHLKHASHGYRWLNAKIRLDIGLVMSDKYAHYCCKAAGIRAKSKHNRYKRPGAKGKTDENIVLANLNITRPYEVIVSDMTAMYIKGIHHELTLYMDLYNNEIVGHGLSNKRGDPSTYYKALKDALTKKEKFHNLETILHSDWIKNQAGIKRV